jgi:formylglycine-generating enzyme required for sulfatase activity
MKSKAMSYFFIKSTAVLCGVIFLVSCQPERSKSTGWHHNSPENFGSGFEKFPAMDQETGPGLTLVEGGTFTMGMTEQDVMRDWNNNPRKVTVPSFYIDQTEVSNFDYLEYLFWLGRVYGSVDPYSGQAYTQDASEEDFDPTLESYTKLPDFGQSTAKTDSLLEKLKGTNAFNKYIINYSESFTSNYQEVFRKALPDTLCWRSPLSSMEHFVNYYLRHPAYRDYPVVGVSWIQANEYCKWRTDRVNEYILAREGILDWEMGNKELNPFQMFSTEAYLSGQYFGLQPQPRERSRLYTDETGIADSAQTSIVANTDILGDGEYTQPSEKDNGRRLRNYNPSSRSYAKGGDGYGARIVRMEDGILLPNYRLPTEAEWEYAATGLIGNLQENSENYTDRRTYPWNGHWVRREEEQFQGSIQANFMRSSGDYMGIAGNLNDGAAPTAPVESYWPNDFGLFHMAGNVSEWVQDVYRPNSLDDVDGFSPFRGNVYTTKLTTTIGVHDAMKNDRIRYDVHGMKQYVLDFERVRYQRIAGSDGESREWDPGKSQGNGKLETDFEFYYGNDVYNNSKFNTSDTFRSEAAMGDILDKFKGKLKGNIAFSITKSSKPVQDNFVINDTTGLIQSKLGIRTLPGKYEIKVNLEDKKLKANYDKTVIFNILDKKIMNADGVNMKSKSANPANARRGTAPDPLFVSSGSLYANETNSQDPKVVFNIKGSQYKNELQFLDSVSKCLDSAINLTNNLRTTEASRLINRSLWGKVFDENYIIKLFPNYLDDPALTTMISILRDGLTEYIIETEGNMRYRRVTEEENLGRLNYRKDDYIDYMDGDIESSIFYQNDARKKDINLGKRDPKLVMYQNDHERYNLDGSAINDKMTWNQGTPTTLVSDRSRVYKGGSWEDNAYWLGCGTRRFLDETQSTRNIGFRCAMDRVGSPTGKNYGKKKKRKS